MATAVGGNPKNDESVSAADGTHDISGKIDQVENCLAMVDAGFDEERVFETREYKMSMEMLEDGRLKGNEMYEKLVLKLSAFQLNCEKIRVNKGPNERQREIIKKSGFSQEYRERLHKSLRELLIHIVNERNMDVKLRQLRQVYEWYFQKNVAMGAYSAQEIKNETTFLNPMND